MGVSYIIIPTSELSLNEKEKRDSFIEHFSSIDAHFFPTDWQIDSNSAYPNLDELYTCFKNGNIIYKELSEERKEKGTIQICFDIAHQQNSYHSDLTIEHLNGQLKSILGIKGDFNILLRLTTQMAKLKGSMIIYSAYDAYYIEKDKTYFDIWEQLKDKWAGKA